ncbi:MAG: hypothetical protein R2693_03190 [Nocardioidaceae bacterium]
MVSLIWRRSWFETSGAGCAAFASALMTARTMGYSLQVPVVGVCSLGDRC